MLVFAAPEEVTQSDAGTRPETAIESSRETETHEQADQNPETPAAGPGHFDNLLFLHRHLQFTNLAQSYSCVNKETPAALLLTRHRFVRDFDQRLRAPIA